MGNASGALAHEDDGPGDFELVRRVRRGDDRAFEQLYERYQSLVMRELEGMSYAAIGERMGMSRAGVESTLFRARKRLSEEYEELASGARCLRVQGIIATGENEKLGARDARRLARHVA